MKIVTAGQMKKIEENAVRCGLGYDRMMENAGSAAAAVIRRTMPVDGRYITIFCGRGNNGGDGFVAARKLAEEGANVVVILTDGEPATEQAKAMLDILRMMEVAVVDYDATPQYLADRLSETDILIDAVYGTGFHGTLDQRHADICRLINGVDAETFSLDIPSGVTADTGFADENAVRADLTVVFDTDKPATVMPASDCHCGQVEAVDIGIPPEAHDGVEQKYVLVNEQFTFDRLKPRVRDTHKGNYGKLLNIAGCQRYMGAAVLSSLAAMRSGAGYVTLASTKELCRTVLPSLPEAVMLPLRQTAEGAISIQALDDVLAAVEKSSAVLVGNGLGMTSDARELVYAVVKSAKCPVVVDADGINALAQNIDIIKQKQCGMILTPHVKEFSRLTKLSVDELKGGKLLPAGLEFAREYDVILVLKGAYTLTVSPDGTVYINTTGNAGLAKAGSGDVLAGIIGALTAQGYKPAEAAACGVFLHGLAGDYASSCLSQYGMLARDVIDALARVLLDNGR